MSSSGLSGYGRPSMSTVIIPSLEQSDPTPTWLSPPMGLATSASSMRVPSSSFPDLQFQGLQAPTPTLPQGQEAAAAENTSKPRPGGQGWARTRGPSPEKHSPACYFSLKTPANKSPCSAVSSPSCSPTPGNKAAPLGTRVGRQNAGIPVRRRQGPSPISATKSRVTLDKSPPTPDSPLQPKFLCEAGALLQLSAPHLLLSQSIALRAPAQTSVCTPVSDPCRSQGCKRLPTYAFLTLANDLRGEAASH